MSDATLLALYLRRIEQRVAALERLEHGAGGSGLDFDNINDLTSATPDFEDEVVIYDVTVGGARKATIGAIMELPPLWSDGSGNFIVDENGDYITL